MTPVDFPYGPKPADDVLKYAIEIADLLVDRGIELLVVACNSATSVALETLQRPIRHPGHRCDRAGHAGRGARSPGPGRVGVIGTVGTIASAVPTSGRRQRGRSSSSPAPRARVSWSSSSRATSTSDQVHVLAERLLAPVRQADIDTLVLGCTHYPLLARTIGDVMGPDVVLMSSADETAFAVRSRFGEAATAGRHGADDVTHRFVTSGDPRRSGARGAIPRSRGRDGGGVVMELTVLGCSGSFDAPRRRSVQRVPGPRRRHVDLDGLRQRHVRPPPAARGSGRGPRRRRDHPRAPGPLRRRLRPARPDALRARVAATSPSSRPGCSRIISALVGSLGRRFRWTGSTRRPSGRRVDRPAVLATDHPLPTYAVEATAGGTSLRLHLGHRSRVGGRRVRSRRRPRAVGGVLRPCRRRSADPSLRSAGRRGGAGRGRASSGSHAPLARGRPGGRPSGRIRGVRSSR